MTPALGCAAVRELAPELALGGLSGPERASAIEHLVRCADCQAYVDELAAVADRLLLLAPEDEPSVGLETRVVARIEDLRPRLRRRRPWLVPVAAAAAVLLAAGSALAVHVADGGGRTAERQMRGAALLDAAHRRVGEAFIYNGSPSWVMVSVDHASADGAYTIVCTGPHAGPLSWPNLRVTDGHGTIAWTAQGPVGGLDRVAVVDGAGHTVYTAALSAQAA